LAQSADYAEKGHLRQGAETGLTAGLFAGVVPGFFIVGLSNTAAKRETRGIKLRSDSLEGKIENAA